MTKLFVFVEGEWICLTAIQHTIPLAKVDFITYKNEDYKIGQVTYDVDKGILEVYLEKTNLF